MKSQSQRPEKSATSTTKPKPKVQKLETWSDQLKRNANTIMLAVTACVVLYFVLRYRSQAAENRSNDLASSMSIIREQGARSVLGNELSGAPAEQIVSRRNSIVSDVNNAIDDILNNAEGDDAPSIKAEALIARGDLNWALANAPPLKAAATQTSLKLPRSQDDYLKAAEGAYKDVISTYPDQIVSWTTAQYGLAAIAENRGDWTTAANTYIAIAGNKAVPAGLQRVANQWSQSIPTVQKSVLMGPLSTTQPAALPLLPLDPGNGLLDRAFSPTSQPSSGSGSGFDLSAVSPATTKPTTGP